MELQWRDQRHRKPTDVTNPTTPSTPLTDFFAELLEEFGSSDEPLADVSIERGAEVIRAIRDGRLDKP